MSTRVGGVVILDSLAASPATPPAARQLLYAKTDGHLYAKNAASTESRLSGNGPVDTGWVAMSLNNGWTNYGAGYTGPRCRKINEIVYVQGLIKPGTFSPEGVQVAQLPAGFFPLESRMFTCIAGYMSMNTANTTPSGGVSHFHYVPATQISVRIDVHPDGTVRLSALHVLGAIGSANPAHLDFFGCKFFGA